MEKHPHDPGDLPIPTSDPRLHGADATEQLRLLSEGELYPYLLQQERWEQRQPWLTPEEQELGSTILSAGSLADQVRVARDIGEEAASAILARVLCAPRPLPSNMRLPMWYPYLQRTEAQLTWMLEAVTVGLTESIFLCSVTLDWPSEPPPTNKALHAIEWAGFLSLNDGLGTNYRSLAVSVYGGHPGLTVSSPWWSGRPFVVFFEQCWLPGPPLAADRLTLVGSPSFIVHHPAQSDSLQVDEEVRVEDLTVSVEFPERRHLVH